MYLDSSLIWNRDGAGMGHERVEEWQMEDTIMTNGLIQEWNHRKA